MRTDTAAFQQKNAEVSKRPRYVIELSFDLANTVLWYLTSNSDAALPIGASAIHNVVEGLSGTSQMLNPDTANATIGSINFSLVDKASIVTSTLGSQLTLGRSTRKQRVRVYIGFEGMAWADYTLVQTQLVTQIEFDGGRYKFICADIQREMRKELFELAKTTLAQSLTSTDTTVEVFNTASFTTVAHGTSYSDSPSATVGYIKIQDEVIKYTGKTSTQFTGCTRGALNTIASDHAVDLAASSDRRTPVEEYVYLEMPAIKLIYALLTGVLHNQGGATLPSTWHLGIPLSYVRLTDFTDSSKSDLWNTADDAAGFVVRFEGIEKTDGKKFIEAELALLCGLFMPIYADGALGLRRMANILAGSAYVKLLNNSNIVKIGPLVHDFNSLRNVIQVNWNWEVAREDFTRVNLLVDASSISVHGKADPLKLSFRGLHGSRHSSTMLAQRFDSIRDRYTGPPLKTEVHVLPSLNNLEVGDVVRLNPTIVRDFVANDELDRSFEIQNTSIDWMSGQVKLNLFGSSQAPGAIPPTADTVVLSDAWYTSQGTNLTSVLTIVGANPGHVTANGSITGNANANSAIFYYNGDLVIDPGVTINISQNVHLRIKGFLTNNGTINGKGTGLAGAVSPGASNSTHHTPGTAGFIGSPIAGGGLIYNPNINSSQRKLSSFEGARVNAPNSAVPSFNLSWDGVALSGLPSDLRGSSGSSGMPATIFGASFIVGHTVTTLHAGGNGGAGGAGLIIICRGFTQGVAGKVDLSGGDGFAGATGTMTSSPLLELLVQAGSGAGGAPGGLLIVLDGSSVSVTGLTEAGAVALYGKTPIVGVPRASAEETPFQEFEHVYSHFVGNGDGTTFARPSLSGSRGGSRVQYIPADSETGTDPSEAVLLAPTNFGLEAGSSELQINIDGTVTTRVRVTWTPSLDPRTLAYDIQAKPSSESVWVSIPTVFGQLANESLFAVTKDGINWDVRIRSAGANRLISDWVTIFDFFVDGKLAPPSNVGVLSFTDPNLSWVEILDTEKMGSIVRCQPGSITDGVGARGAHVEGFVTETKFNTGSIVGGQTTMLVKAVDTSGNESLTASSLLVDLRPATPTSFTMSRQADGTRELAWDLLSPPVDLAGFRVRYFLGSTSDWSAMTPMHTGLLIASPFESNQLAAGTYTLAIKSVDMAGNESTNALFISTTLGDPRIAGAIEDLKEEPTWLGTKTSCHVDVATGWLVADGSGTWSSLPSTWDAWTEWNDTPVSPISYVRQIDVGLKLKFTPLVTVLADGSQVIEEQHSDDNVSYSSYAAVGPQVDARYIRIRVTITGSYPKIKTMRIILTSATINEIIEDQNTASLAGAYRIGVGDIRLPITKVYSIIKKVDVTLQSVGGGWSWELIDKNTATGPRIKIYNSSNTLADAVIDATVTGI